MVLSLKRLAVLALLFALLAALVLAVGWSFVFMQQDREVFPGALMEFSSPDLAGFPGAERVEAATGDGEVLRGWFIRSNKRGPRPLLIYFGGNAEEVTANAPLFGSMLDSWSLLLVNYRGFGQSTGKPSEDALFRDALHLYDMFASRKDVSKDSIVAMGWSLGTGVAVYLASERPAKGVILASPYDSITSLARRYHPGVPSFLVKHKFDSISRAPGVNAPVLVAMGTEDGIIPLEYSMRLAKAWGGRTETIELKGAQHNLFFHPRFWPKVKEFLADLQ